jgi:hypothetical protein
MYYGYLEISYKRNIIKAKMRKLWIPVILGSLLISTFSALDAVPTKINPSSQDLFAEF